MLIKSAFKILILSVIVLVSCQSQEHYIYENIKPEIELYLHQQMFNDFAQSDTLIIYDTVYFNNMIEVLSNYQDKLVVEDSMYNRQINERLSLIKTQQIQSRQPEIYLPFESINKNLNEENTDKIMVWLSGLPKQFEAAKVQLEKPDKLATKQAIEELTTAYNFITDDLTIHLNTLNKFEDYSNVLDNTKFAIKDYLAFLNSKLINQETN